MRVDSEVGEVAEVLVQLKGEWVVVFPLSPNQAEVLCDGNLANTQLSS